ncbi:erad-associated E3 ubiquitin-protein ligase hrd1a [Phtheirospermum japonicum]|uniref:RING-type E3 ubiquitin transferase n=1 Tax=Phtheirospermum japonicum TaxID=374723 RepID=A0A830BUP0_9LAMI|nr:erad-associated E3 ubiquitin-protein ligase hrd1a [Phtheirospermum japonicum]
MMKLQTYAGFSLIATLAVIYHAFSSRGQFYPAMVHLSTSKISLALLLNMGLVFMCILWQLTKKIFLGSLREAEIERLNEQSWREVMEILFAITIFRQDFSVSFIAMVTALLLIKALHWLAQKRVEYIETTPSVPKLSHIRIVSFMGFLFLIDSGFLFKSIMNLVETRQASVSLFFAFEYMILATTTVATIVKYAFYLYETFRNFKIRVADYLRYRKITSNMNDRFPDATPEEINSSDATCIICREEMVTAKKLLCGHLFHVHCLRSWLERQNTCPTCRALVVPSETAASTTGKLTALQVHLLKALSSGHPGHTVVANNGGDGVSIQHPNMTFAQLPQWAETADSQHDLQVKLIEHHIEFLQRQLQLLKTSNSEKKRDMATSDLKGKSVTSSLSSSIVEDSMEGIMDPTEIARLVEEMKRTRVGEEDKVILDGNSVKIEADRVKMCLLANVFSIKQTNRETFKQQILKILQTAGIVEVEAVGENLFIIEFRSTTDRRRALTEGPWNFFKIEEEEIIIILVYERLPEFCYACGRTGHLFKDCEDNEVNKDNLGFGNWLKAGSHSGGKKSREEGKTQARSTCSGSSTSNRAITSRKNEFYRTEVVRKRFIVKYLSGERD